MELPHRIDISRLAVLDQIASRHMGARKSAHDHANDLRVAKHQQAQRVEELREQLRLRGGDALASNLKAAIAELEGMAGPLDDAIANEQETGERANAAGNLASHARQWAASAGLIRES